MGLIYFQKIHSLDFFHRLSRETQKNTGLSTLVSWNFDREIYCYFVFCILVFSEHVLCQNSIFVCKRVKHVLNYYSAKFHEILTSGSIEISAFPLNRAGTIFWLTARVLHLAGFLIFLDPYKQFQKGRVFSNSITFNTLKNKRFSHIHVNKRKKHLHNLYWTEWSGLFTGSMFVFLKASCVCLFTSAVQIIERTQTVFSSVFHYTVFLFIS